MLQPNATTNAPEPAPQQTAYRGKHFTIPELSREGVSITPDPTAPELAVPAHHPIVEDMNSTWDLRHFEIPRSPLTLGVLDQSELQALATRAPRVLDLPIKFPGSDFRLPKELAHLAPIIQRLANAEAQLNRDCYDEYYCYLTLDQGVVRPGALQREAPCHVDGFQGARWNPKVRINHTYCVSDNLPTTFYVQPFDFSALDERKHDFFWEMNRQVARTDSVFAWQPRNGELTLMDAYTVHRGSEATEPTQRTFLRVSFEVRIFDRLGNAHNPMFNYHWTMVPRDIEALGLTAFDPGSDPTLRVFPHQKTDGTPHGERTVKTQPNLRPGTPFPMEMLRWVPEDPHSDRGWVNPERLAALAAWRKENIQ